MSNQEIQKIVPVDDAESQELQRHQRDDGPILGQWYWVKTTARPDREGRTLFGHEGRQGDERLMCAMKIGSNYIELRSPDNHQNGHHSGRVHLEDFWSSLRHEPDALRILTQWAKRQEQETARLVNEIHRITARLGMTPAQAITHAPGASAAPAGGALVTLSATQDVSSYKSSLVHAKEVELPALYEHLKASNGNLSSLLHAQVLPAQASVGDLQQVISDIDDRIFSVGLYAGLCESATACQTGAPAPAHEKLHVMQSMLYMDEECLANYRHGGMEFADITAFDQWLCQPENLDRILPFPRTLVAMRVRRFEKKRAVTNLREAYINIQLAQADKLTFLYVRNGEQVWCIQTDLEFDSFIFPDRTAFDPSEPKMVKLFGSRIDRFTSRSAWEQMCADYDSKTSTGERAWHLDDPRHGWHPVDHSSVYFDDAMAAINAEIQKYNRVAVIIQGLFDRSPILHPHPPVQTWTAEGFNRAIELVYDGAWTLSHGDAPDFDAYRARCNATLCVGSMTIGQEDAWELLEAERECARRDRNWRDRGDYRPERFRPHGNPGPGYIARVDQWSKTNGATYRWERLRLSTPGRWEAEKSGSVTSKITVAPDKLFNVDAYQLGDFKRFFADRRTRALYLQWAPMLIAAEEYVYKKQKQGGHTVED